MKIYKVPGNFLKGVEEFEALQVNPDNTFTYEIDLFGKIRVIHRVLKSRHPNDSNYFVAKEEAKVFIIGKITKSIERHESLIQKAQAVLSTLQ